MKRYKPAPAPEGGQFPGGAAMLETYVLYDNYMKPRFRVRQYETSGLEALLKQAGFNHVEERGGRLALRSRGNEIAAIDVFMFSDSPTAHYTLERIYPEGA
jgi:hypothetical protein